MVADPCEYTWSSHRCHGAGHADPILDSFPEWEQLGRTEPERRARWRRKVRGKQPAKELDGVRSSARSGRPCGAEDWVEVISHRLGIVREPRRRGRPPREKMLRHWNSPDTGIPPSGIPLLTLEFPSKRCSDTGIPPPLRHCLGDGSSSGASCRTHDVNGLAV
jgi:putative transposase